ncbi:cytochrome c55X [Chitinivorax tropicus]|uniref:Cytochrome c55X n=1 Tax=Chitinivorax tropicus TaxID=714531 RepID=A0A840MFW8_9PROT|nr:cytochrome c [Chitinivorax tropicus]MBB5018144.1 cytochrome c55X [Chitinivorax tropicus]
MRMLPLLFLLLCQLAAAAPPEPARQAALLHLLKQDCGACHGMTRQGGLGPPLTAAALRDKPSDSLIATILYGRPGTAMPPWQRFLTESEVAWLIDTLRSEESHAPAPPR